MKVTSEVKDEEEKKQSLKNCFTSQAVCFIKPTIKVFIAKRIGT